ncbi:MAG: sulfurtransferase TusA family protein [Spirochaetia bacterium]|jgi:TusA-related sulfurtransferase|nr:sulfurtransferase TusA family protein [Spirochaetia bacterium]
MNVVDARGLSCPVPVVMTKKALKDKPAELKVLVDNRAAFENVTRFAKAMKYDVVQKEEGDDLVLELRKL